MSRRLACIVVGLLMGWSTTLLGASPKEQVDKLNTELERGLRAQSPEAADLFLRAVAASEKQDHKAAADLYARLRELVPGFTPALRRQGMEELRLGNHEQAVALCREAVSREPSEDNLSALSTVLSASPDTAHHAEALELAIRATAEAPDDFFALSVLGQAAMVNNDISRLKEAADRLVALAPQESTGYFFRAVAEASQGDFDEAEATLALARKHGLPEESYRDLAKGIGEARPWYDGLLVPVVWTISLWLGSLLILLLVGWGLSRAALRVAERMPSQPTGEAHGLDARLRRLYQGVLWLSCVYYWISIPLVVLTVLGVAGALLLAIFAFGHIPVKLVVIIVVVAGVSLVSIVKSLLVRGRDEDPGLQVDPQDEPRLAGALREVADRIGTRPVDNVYLTPGTDLAVMERGGMLKQLGGTPERCLILGVGVLDGMKLGPFKAILAHEYGHFSNRDTAGGGLALAVRRSLLTMAHHLAAGGAATWYNPAWLFVNGFYHVFLRISQGASRLQEVLADRWAAFTYGGEAFERGLRHVIERSVRFDAAATAALNEVIQKKQPLPNLYAYRPSQLDTNSISYEIEEAFRAEPSPYDSHPCPADRIRWVQAIGSGQASPEDNAADAWSLFQDREEIERRLTRQVRENIQINAGVSIPEEAPAVG